MDIDTQSRRQEERTILISFVLDKSGSMGVIQEATISGFNQFLEDQQREGGSAAMTLTLFDTRFRTVVSAKPIGHVRPLDRRTYVPGGNTALYDAIAHTLRATDEYVALHRPDQVLFVVMTDGEENASREFDRRQVMAMIEDRQKTAGYEFLYLGANQDSYRVGGGIGIHGGRTLDYAASPAQTRAVMDRVSANVKAHRRTGMRTQADGEFFSDRLESLGKTSWDEYQAERDRQAAPDAAAPTDDTRAADAPAGDAQDGKKGR